MSQTVQVRIRTASNPTAAPLTEWPIGDLDSLIRLLDRWGLYDDEDGYSYFTLTGQFVLAPGGAWFELVANAEEE